MIDLIINLILGSHFFQNQLTKLKQSNQASFSNVFGSSSSALIAALAQQFKTILINTSSTEKAEALKEEIKLFCKKAVVLFPAPDILPSENIKPSHEIIGERMSVLKRLAQDEELIVVSPVKAVMWRTSRRLENIRVAEDQRIRIDKLIEMFIEFGYRRFDIVGERGEFSVRGGIIDIFPPESTHPIRIEMAEDKIESLRHFDPYTQRSIGKISQCVILAANERFEIPVFKHLSKEALIIFDEKIELERYVDRLIEESKYISDPFKYLSFKEIIDSCHLLKQIELSAFLKPGEESFFTSPPSYLNRFGLIPKEAILISKHATRLKEEVNAQIIQGSLRSGFIFMERQVLGDRELFGEEVVFRKTKVVSKEGVADELLADLKPGDYIVHENYGIGLYHGIKKLEIDNIRQEYLLLEYAQGDKVYLPPALAGLIEKYSSAKDFTPKLSRLGSKRWETTKRKVKKALQDMTKDLMLLYAARQKLAGFTYPPDDIWQKELEGTFPYEETPDQRKAIEESKRDMESSRPMDRLILGDVGYGKTEVAIRAAAKALSAGKQVAVLVPTTILAEQHYTNFKNRLSSTPFVVEMLSRFRAKKDQLQVVEALARGGVDIVVGTHRLLSKDIKFNDLGLLIVDEEQKFGVAHKEKLKKLKLTCDVLTLSATPIPRTLYLSLSGARDMSLINTPPIDRSPVKTYVLAWNENVIREAIARELDRGGQAYFVHNFVETIDGMASKIKKLVPEARVAIAHGQMHEKTLESIMDKFLNRKFDVLVCTSIIESGLDISNVNTLLIDQADRLGLSQLYQIRGRVGRSAVRAYAYLFYRPDKVMTEQALERLKAIQEFSALGSGFKLAMRDLEIRGAGNLLGAQQSGHIAEVGFDLYCELLEQAVAEAKGIKEVFPREVEIDLKIEAYIPSNYITDDRQRIAVYRRMNLLRKKSEVDDIRRELVDRFGKIPPTMEKLFSLLNLKVYAYQNGVKKIKEEDGSIKIERLSGKIKKIKIEDKDKIKFAMSEIAQ